MAQDEGELETGRVKPARAYSDAELGIWWLVAQVLKGAAGYEQRQMAAAAEIRAERARN